MNDSTGIKQSLSHFFKEFKEVKKRSIETVENYLLDDVEITAAVRASLHSQIQEFTPDIFQWLYECLALKKKSTKVFVFVMQFVPELVYLYLLCVTENYQKLKAPVEVLLLGISKELEIDKNDTLQVPSLTRPSIYHQNVSLVSQSRLTESALSRHDHEQATPPSQARPTLTNKEITVTNRLPFLTVVTKGCISHMTQFKKLSQTAFCLICTRITMSGMSERCIANVVKSVEHADCFSARDLLSLRTSKRINLSDDFLLCLLHGIKLCLFQACHFPARQALVAAKTRAEYNLFYESLQISQSLERLVNEIHPMRLPLDTETHKTYSSKDASNWASRPSTVMRTFMGQVLYYNLNPPSSNDNPHDVSDERLSMDADELLISQSFEDGSQRKTLERPASDSPDGGAAVTFQVERSYFSSDEDERNIEVENIDESPSVKRKPIQRDSEEEDTLSTSGVTVVLKRPTQERENNISDSISASSKTTEV